MSDVEISVNTEVRSSNGPCGLSVCLVLDPVREKVTHLVVQEDDFPQTQRLVAIALIKQADSEHIDLACSTDHLKQMDSFVDTEFIRSEPTLSPVLLWPYVEPVPGFITIEHEKLPTNEIAVRRGTPVHATDGTIGHVDELLVDRQSGTITHLVLREGHLWGRKDVSIPVSQIRSLDQDGIQLELTKREIEALPEIPIHRAYR